MTDWERTDALLHWLATFELDNDDFLQNSNKLLDGFVLAKVYNKLANDPIDISKFNQVTKESDWIYMLLNMRQIVSHISPILKESNIDISVDVNSMVRKKDQNELLKFLQYFLFFSMKAPNRKISISNIRSLDRSYQIQIQSILEEFTNKIKETAKIESQVSQSKSIENVQSKQKLESLQKEIEELKSKAQSQQEEIRTKTLEVDQLDSDISTKMRTAMSEIKGKCQNEENRREQLLSEIKKYEDSISNAKSQINELKEKQSEISKQIEKGVGTDLTTQQLNEKLKIIEKKALKRISETSETFSKQPSNTIEIIQMLRIPEKQAQLKELTERINNYDKNVLMRKAEYDALKAQLDDTNQKASVAMLRRVAQLNAEMDASPLGEGKRKQFQLRRAIQKLGNDIQNLEMKTGSSMELNELQKEVANMAQRKAYESDLLAKKLSFMQSTREQCELKLERLKLHAGLQLHSNRLKRWKNCFSNEFQNPK